LRHLANATEPSVCGGYAALRSGVATIWCEGQKTTRMLLVAHVMTQSNTVNKCLKRQAHKVAVTHCVALKWT